MTNSYFWVYTLGRKQGGVTTQTGTESVMQHKDLFWDNLERAYADQDNAEFDALQYREKQRRKERREKFLVIGGLIAAVLVTFIVYGQFIFRMM